MLKGIPKKNPKKFSEKIKPEGGAIAGALKELEKLEKKIKNRTITEPEYLRYSALHNLLYSRKK